MRPTGQELVQRLREAARAAGKPLYDFARPLSTQTSKWVRELGEADKPNTLTISRIDALIAGRAIPPARRRPDNAAIIARQMERRSSRADGLGQHSRVPDPPVPQAPPPLRDPCPWCAQNPAKGLCAHLRRLGW